MPQLKFFLEKQLINFNVPICPFHSTKFLKNSYGRSKVTRISHFGHKMAHLIWTNFFRQKPLLISSTYWPFSLCKTQKNFLQQIQSYENVPFLGSKWSICPKQIFFLEKIINVIFIYLLALFIVQNLKKILTADPELWRCVIFGPKMAHLPNWGFFAANIHACLHAKNETEPSLQPIDTEIVNGIPYDIMLDHPTLGLAMSVWRDGQNEFLMSELLTITLHHSIM